MNTFQLTGPLPASTLVLEASAGTGKTYAIAGLAVRYVAEKGIRIGSMLIIAFNVHAAAELRARVFAALRSSKIVLANFLADGTRPDAETDPIGAHLVTLEDCATALQRIDTAIAEFDSATILTTHSFSNLTLKQLGILGDADHAEEMSQGETLVEECAADVYVNMFSSRQEAPFSWWHARDVARKACATTLTLEPQGSDWANYGKAVREQFEIRKRDLGIVTFNDLITRLADVLEESRITAAFARRWLQDRYAVVLVDEFQDTDPAQWQVIRRAFVAPDRPTVLIGDPKQSIYGFRNADILSYLDAKSHADVLTLGTNYRSDKGVVDGVTSLLEGLELGHEDIQVLPVEAKHGSRFQLPPAERIWIRRVAAETALENPKTVRDDVALQIEAALGRDMDGRKVTLSDIAVLTRTAATASSISQHLVGLGYPVVQFGGLSVWKQPAADDWRWLLRALSPDAAGEKRVAALTDLLGIPIAELVDAETSHQDVLQQARHALYSKGARAALEAVRRLTGLDARLTPTVGGSRYLTDAMHVAELLDESGHRDPLLLLKVIDEARNLDDDAALRLASDTDVIKIMTLHAAKGLEFPIVLLPDMSPSRQDLKLAFNVVVDGKRRLWLGGTTDDDLAALATEQARAEELRLLYVGLTRAKHLAILWHEEAKSTPQGPVSAAVFRDRMQPRLRPSYRWALSPRIPGVLTTEAGGRAPSRHMPVLDDAPIELATMIRAIDPHWRRTSYSGLTAGLHEAAAGNVEVPSGADEVADLEIVPDPELSTPAPLGPLPAGAAFGTLVHEVLERLDWAPSGRLERLSALIDDVAVGYDADQRRLLVEGLDMVVDTPLSPLADASLADIPIAHRLPELDFDLPMGGADVDATLGQLAELLAKHLPADDPLADYPRRLAESPVAPAVLRGILTGSIDAVLQLDDGSFGVVDYKTNRLAPSAEDVLTVGHYAPEAMAEAMMSAHYPLQAILYCAALHRYLRLRLPDYAPSRHLGGVGYLFVRGMAGPGTPIIDGHACGVFTWKPSPELIVAVSELLGGTNA